MAWQKGYRVGEAVEGHYRNGNWYGARISSIQEDGLYVLDWNDGDTQDRGKSAIRLRAPAASGDAAVCQSLREVEMDKRGRGGVGGLGGGGSERKRDRQTDREGD
jgi:hypothetical protein